MLGEKFVDIAKSLEECEIFQSLPQPDIESLVHLAKLQTYHPKEFIFIQGDPIDRLFVLINGVVKLSGLNQRAR